MSFPPSPRQGRYIWLDDSAPLRNQFVRFERTFHLDEVHERFPLNLFADTRYRLRVNGDFVAAGPGRFVTQFPEFDTHDLAKWLRRGANTISVEVNFFGTSSYQSMPDGQPGFIAWGGADAVDLATPGGWQGFRLHAWRWDAPLFSFAQNPVEICDTRLAGQGTPERIAVLENGAVPWGELTPYSGAPIPFSEHRPKRIELAGRLENGERRIGFMSHDPDGSRALAEVLAKPWAAFATWIHSPRAQTVTLSCFWSDLQCNGKPVAVDTDTPYGNHGHCSLALDEGWNLLAGKLEILSEYWAFCLGIPDGAELSLHGRRLDSCLFPLAISPSGPKENLTLPLPEDTEPPKGWTMESGDPMCLTPARMMGWDIPAGDSIRNIQHGRLPEVSTIQAKEATWCFSFAGEFLGHVFLDVEGPEGAILDVASDDWQSEHGGAALYQSNPFTDSADRFILRGGRQRIDLFHPRGGKVLQVTMRSPDEGASLCLHEVFVRSRQTFAKDETRFSCDNPTIEWAWPVAMRTLITSTDESYSDCPWRERGSYIGDSYVNLDLNLLLSPYTRTARRTLRIFAQAQLPDGQLAGCAPAWLRLPHEDFTMVWLLALREYWALTGDTSLVKEVWPAVHRIWASPTWDSHPSGLWNATGKRLFIDWGTLHSEREGTGNSTLNLFRFGALKACADLAATLGQTEEVSEFLGAAKSVEDSLRAQLWDEAQGRFLPSIGAETPALHANVLALAFGIGSAVNRAGILSYLEPLLAENFARGIRNGHARGHLELYFFQYALPALAAHGRPDLAELLIEQHYGYLRALGDDTLPECFCQVERGTGSRCHSWSGAAAIYAARHVLGIRPAMPGNPRRLICDPVVHGISRASGHIAHPDGWIDVSWVKRDGAIHADIQAPKGVQVEHKQKQWRETPGKA